PKASQAAVDDALGWSVKEGKLWLTHGQTSLCAEEIPTGLLVDDARLQPPPKPIPAKDVLPNTLPDAWGDEVTTAQEISEALSRRAGKPLPWPAVRSAIDGAFHGRLLERAVDSGPWPCDVAGAKQVKLKVRRSQTLTPTPTPAPTPSPPDVLIAT